MNIRRASPEDSPAVYELICDLESERFDIDAFEKLYLGNMAEKDILYLVAEDDGKAIGFISCHGQVLLHHMEKVFEIQELVVDKERRNREVGELLVREAEKLLKEKGYRFIEVTTNIKREAAHRFYEKCHYSKTHYKYTKVL